MKVLMIPSVEKLGKGESGIHRVVQGLTMALPEFGVELVKQGERFDLKAVHAGVGPQTDVAHCHGLYWTADYESEGWEYYANLNVIRSLREAKEIIVPSHWVAQNIARDLRVYPHVIGHGIDWEAWQGKADPRRYALWNKNRIGDVCDPEPLRHLASRFREWDFAATFSPKNPTPNIQEIGPLPHQAMRKIVKDAWVYLSTTKETFGIGTLEAMASGVPVLGYAEGGNLELVEHGITGYLAKPKDLDDLAEGFDYCVTHRDQLGANGREAAKAWTWRKAAEKTAEVYRLALQGVQELPYVTVVIPSYNYGPKVGRAIESALDQRDNRLAAVIVVDDGSADDTGEVVAAWTRKDPRVQYIRQERTGVSGARNAGIRAATTKYICCLDADDAVEPKFLTPCLDALEADPAVGIAYTGLRFIKPDGTEGRSPWPGVFDFDRQLRRQNQIPTCCVFRRRMWERLGGYKDRYLGPAGAGAEDGEFWLRAGAYGYNAIRATEAPLFIYSWQSGRVSGDKNYLEVDWTTWHPWTKDGKHPFGSVATPKRISHPVRQYDQPLISVVIPVGPHHHSQVFNALDSLEAQTLRDWEAVVVADGPWEKDFEAFKTAYPYPTYLSVPDGPKGAGVARNLGAARSKGSFLVFLDADDWLYPEALERMLDVWTTEAAVVYTDYVGKAQVEDVTKLDIELQKRVYQHKDGQAVIGYKAADFDCEKALRQPEATPFIWCNVTCLIPKAWHDEIGGFDEKLRSWEDVDYHWRMARAGKCYAHLSEELMVYQFGTGSRRDSGRQDHRNLVEYLRAKYQEAPDMGCNCGGRKRAIQPPARGRDPETIIPQGGTMKDSDYSLCRYTHPNRGKHKVVGPATKINYGYRAGGDTFLVHEQDIQATHLFQKIAPLPAPVVHPAAPPPPPVIAPKPKPEPAAPAAPEVGPGAVWEGAERTVMVPSVLDLQSLPGVTPGIEKALKAAGLLSVEAIKAAGEEGLMKVKGIGPTRAKAILKALEKA